MLIVCLFFRVDLTLSEERWQGVQQVFRWTLSCCPPWISLFFPFFLSLQQKRRCTAVRRSCAHTFQWQTGPHARAADWRYSLKHDQAWSFRWTAAFISRLFNGRPQRFQCTSIVLPFTWCTGVFLLVCSDAVGRGVESLQSCHTIAFRTKLHYLLSLDWLIMYLLFTVLANIPKS